MHIEFLDMCDLITFPLKFIKLGDLKVLGNGVIVMVLSNGYGQSFANLKVFESVQSLRALREFFISSHSEFIGGVMGALGPGAPNVRYVTDAKGWYGKP